jgi:hypothetical protein
MLCSELNFPFGPKCELDLGEDCSRWNLPIHLLDAILYATTGRLATANAMMTTDSERLLDRIRDVIRLGIDHLALSSSPHLVLLSLPFYHGNIKPLLARWTLSWIVREAKLRVDMADETPASPGAANEAAVTATQLVEVCSEGCSRSHLISD